MKFHYRAENYKPSVIFLLSFLFANVLIGQPLMDQKGYDKNGGGKYLFPIKPNRQNFLSGNMGELRPGHFHAGLDIKTEGVIGMPVYATADGYIYRVRVSPRGYGKALYLQHDDGTKSLYGHLEKFDEAIEAYALERHYQLEKNEIDVYPPKNKFKFNKGDIIAYGGNTGSSAGPHLHFEIRQPNDAVLNPLKFDFDEIRDNIAPVASRVALVTRGENSRLNGTFGRIELPLYRSGRVYRNNTTIKAHGTIGVEFQGVDRANMTSNTYGISKVVMEVNGRELYRHEIDLIPFEVTRMIHLFANYKVWQEKNRRFQRCYKVDGNRLPFYEDSPSNGFFVVPDSGLYQLNIHLYDTYENHSIITLQIEGAPLKTVPAYPAAKHDNKTTIENLYSFAGDAPTSAFYLKGQSIEKEADYQYNGQYHFLWDLRLGLPDSVENDSQMIKTNFVSTFMPYASTTFFHKDYIINVPKGAISDTLYLTLNKEDNIYHFGSEGIPLFRSVDLTLTPDQEFQDRSYKIYRLNSRNRPSFVGGEWHGNSINFSTRSFGKFLLLQDERKPSLRVLRRDSNKIVCRIDDGLSGIKDYRASIDGEWLLMLYDYRRNLIWSKRKNPNVPLKGSFRLEITDNAGNVRIYNSQL